MKTIKTYESFNHRRYSNPWVAPVLPGTTKPDFSKKVGGYTGAYGKGEAGNLYVSDPVEGQVYTYGQKDYRAGSRIAGTSATKAASSTRWTRLRLAKNFRFFRKKLLTK